MLELLFVVALVSWAVISVLQYLAALPAAPTLLVAALVTPVLAFLRVRQLARQLRIEFVCRGSRRPLPPERFYWPSARRRLGRRVIVAGCLAAACWPVAILWPAGTKFDAASGAGWIAGFLAVTALAETAGALWLYVKTSQRFNRQSPGLVGWVRRGLYRLSDNHEFLGEEPLPREKPAREAVY